MTGDALRPVVDVGISVIIYLVTVRAVLVLFVAETARVAEVEYFALNETVAPKG